MVGKQEAREILTRTLSNLEHKPDTFYCGACHEKINGSELAAYIHNSMYCKRCVEEMPHLIIEGVEID